MMIASILSVMLFAVTPGISTMPTPCAGPCAPRSPAEVIQPWDIDGANEIYRPYFECYWSALNSQPTFGSKVASEARGALLSANDKCKELGAEKDRLFDGWLQAKADYGTQENKLKVRDKFRRQGSILFMYMAASASGKRAEYLATMQAAMGRDQG